jgi:2-aminoadipate transaminase
VAEEPPAVSVRDTTARRSGPDWTQRFASRAARGGGALTAILSQAVSTDVITFSGGFPAPETFPAGVLQRLTDQLLADEPDVALQYSPTEGLPSVRVTVADLVADRQGQRPDPDELLITSGGIEGLQLLARVLIDPGDVVLLEAPTYLGAIMAFGGFEAQVRGVGLDADGLRVDDLEHLDVGTRLPPKLLYVIPDHQNPSGLSLSTERRHALVAWARRHGVLLVEDVAYRELAFDGSTKPSLWSLAPEVVLQLGTFSKIFTPGVRLGWAIGPEPIVAAMTAAKQNSDQCAGALGQRLMERYVRGGHLAEHLVAARRLYGTRAAAMLSALEEHMPPDAHWTQPRGGFFVWLTAPAGLDTAVLAPRATELGVSYVPGRPCYPEGGGENQVRLAYSRARDEQIAEGIRRLGNLFKRTAAGAA